MLAVAAVRFVLLPSATTLLVLGALRMGLLPADPVCAFMLLLQSCMPPAQNLVLMMQLQQSTAGLAPATARLLLQLYTLAVLPVTLWVSVFAKLVL
jgi:predicted permease